MLSTHKYIAWGLFRICLSLFVWSITSASGAEIKQSGHNEGTINLFIVSLVGTISIRAGSGQNVKDT